MLRAENRYQFWVNFISLGFIAGTQSSPKSQPWNQKSLLKLKYTDDKNSPHKKVDLERFTKMKVSVRTQAAGDLRKLAT